MTMKMMRRASYKGPSGGPDFVGFSYRNRTQSPIIESTGRLGFLYRLCRVSGLSGFRGQSSLSYKNSAASVQPQ